MIAENLLEQKILFYCKDVCFVQETCFEYQAVHVMCSPNSVFLYKIFKQKEQGKQWLWKNPVK